MRGRRLSNVRRRLALTFTGFTRLVDLSSATMSAPRQSLRQIATSSRDALHRPMNPSRFRSRPGVQNASFHSCKPRWTSQTPAQSSASAASTPSSHAEALERARRAMANSREKMYRERHDRNKSIVIYAAGSMVLALGFTYAAVPLYRAFCSATGFGGAPMTDSSRFTPDRLYPSAESAQRKRITVHFEATAADTLPWSFEPQTRSVKVLPGETALAFYTAKNTGDKDLVGIATYNMTPQKVAPYFAKVECFCFEEQKIRAGEEVDLPVFFFIDRDICDDPGMDGLDDVVLSYTFFKARRNERGDLEPDAAEDVVQKSQGFETYELAKNSHKLSAPPQKVIA